MAGTSYIQWKDDDVHFVLDQYVSLNLHSASSLKQQSKGRNVAPPRHIAQIQTNLSFLLLLKAVCLAEKQQTPIA